MGERSVDANRWVFDLLAPRLRDPLLPAGKPGVRVFMNALTEKRYLTLPEPSAGDTLAARERLLAALPEGCRLTLGVCSSCIRCCTRRAIALR